MIELMNRMAESWWTWMSGMFWQVGLLIVIIACLDALIRRWAWPQVRYALWLLVMVKLVLPPDLHLASSIGSKLPELATVVFHRSEPTPTPRPRAETLPQSEGLVSFSIVEASHGHRGGTNAPTAYVHAETLDRRPSPPAVATERSAVLPRAEASWRSYALALWLLGMLVLSSWLWIKLRGLRRDLPRQIPEEALPASFFPLAEQCAHRLGLRRVPEIRLTRSILCPAVTGVFRPVLLVPVDFTRKLSPQSTEHMLLHEFAHIKRGDLYVHGVYMVLQIVYWFNPLLWLVSRQIHHLREICCDATVAKHLKERTMEYRQTLIEVARRYLVRSAAPGMGLLGLFEDSNHLAVRLESLRRHSGRYARVRVALAAGLVLLMMVCVLPMAQGQDAPGDSQPAATQVAQTDEGVGAQIQTLAEQLKALEKQRETLQRQLALLEVQREIHAAGRGQIQQAKSAQTIAGQQMLFHTDQQTLFPGERPDQVKRTEREVAIARKKDVEKEKLKTILDRAARIREGNRSVDAAESSLRWEDQEARWQAWAEQMEQWGQRMDEYGRQVEAWTNSPQFKAFQEGVENRVPAWTEQDEGRGDESAPPQQNRSRRRSSSRISEPQLPPLPPMPTLPPLPAMPVEPPVSVAPPVPSVDAIQPRPLPEPRPILRDLEVEVPISVPNPVVTAVTSRPLQTPGLRRVGVLQTPSAPRPLEPEMFADSTAISQVGPDSGQTPKLTRTESHMLAVKAGQPIHVINRVGNINVAGGAGEGLLLTVLLGVSGDDGAASLIEALGVEVTERKEGLFIESRKPEESLVEGLAYHTDMNIVVPEGCTLILQEGDGNIAVTRLSGSLTIHHEDGEIACREISGGVSISLEDGPISCREISGDVSIALEDGVISCQEVSGAISISLEDGDILCKQISGDLSIVLEDGDISLDRIAGGSYAIQLEDGQIRGEALLASGNVEVEDGNVKLTYGPGVPADCSVRVAVDDGDIQLTLPAKMVPADRSGLPKKSEDDGARWKTAVNQGGLNHLVNLKTDNGSIQVTVED